MSIITQQCRNIKSESQSRTKDTEFLYTCKKTTASVAGDIWVRSTRRLISTTNPARGGGKISKVTVTHTKYMSKGVGRGQTQHTFTEGNYWNKITRTKGRSRRA